MGILPACISVHPQNPEKGFGSSGTAVSGSCKLLCGLRDPNLDHLEQHLMLLANMTSPQHPLPLF